MAELVSPAGTKVQVADDLAIKLICQGWTETKRASKSTKRKSKKSE